jgi:hypothetical protein
VVELVEECAEAHAEEESAMCREAAPADRTHQQYPGGGHVVELVEECAEGLAEEESAMCREAAPADRAHCHHLRPCLENASGVHDE